MAASGINEHNEARRKQHYMDRAAYMHKRIVEDLSKDALLASAAAAAPSQPSSRYAMGGHDGASVDRQRREWALQNQCVEYTAKIPNRYNSIKYNQQW